MVPLLMIGIDPKIYSITWRCSVNNHSVLFPVLSLNKVDLYWPHAFQSAYNIIKWGCWDSMLILKFRGYKGNFNVLLIVEYLYGTDNLGNKCFFRSVFTDPGDMKFVCSKEIHQIKAAMRNSRRKKNKQSD